MNQNILYPNHNFVPAAELHFCFKCRWEGRAAPRACPRCGSVLFSQTNVRYRGLALTVIGIFLSGLMGVITIFVTGLLINAADDPKNAPKFENEGHLFVLMYLIFGSLFIMGVTLFIAGVWQCISGRRNMFLLRVFFFLIFVTFFTGAIFRGFVG